MAAQQPQKKLTKAEAGRLGGLQTKQRHGSEHYRRAGKLGADAVLKKYGLKHFRQLGKAGFLALATKIGLWNPHDVQSGRSRAIDFLARQHKLKPRYRQYTQAEMDALGAAVEQLIDELTKDQPEEEENPVVAHILRSIRSAPLPPDGGL